MQTDTKDIVPLQLLWDGVLRNEEEALRRLHHALYAQLLHYAAMLLQDENLAEDVVQEVFIKAWAVRQKTGKLVHVKAWFYTLLRRRVLNQLRNNKQGLRRIGLLAAQGPDIEFSAEDIIMRREQEADRRQQVRDLLNQLPVRQKEVIFLKYFKNLEYKDIANIMGINYQSVVNLAYKAISFLKAAWKNIGIQ